MNWDLRYKPIIPTTLIIALMFFFIGFHNVDLSVNVLKISHDYSINLFDDGYDISAVGEKVNYVSLYRKGIVIMILSFMYVIIVAMLTITMPNKGSGKQ